MNRYEIDGTGLLTPEPDWPSLFHDELEIAAAKNHWRVITIEMRDRGTLTPSNGQMILRLILTYTEFDRASRQVTEHGSVIKPKRGNTRAIARVNPYFNIMCDLSNEALRLEGALGLTPRHRGSVSKAERRSKVARAADTYLKPVNK